jgi:hypothetical protein
MLLAAEAALERQPSKFDVAAKPSPANTAKRKMSC